MQPHHTPCIVPLMTGSELRRIRKRLGLTQVQLAERLGVTGNTVARQERGEVRITACSTGNPHCSLFVNELDDKTVERLGSQLERHPAFPNRTNVEFIRVLNEKEIQVAFWERGVGPTYASGTGSCGAAVASILNGKTGRNVTIHTKGGKLTVEWPEDGRLKLTSTATIVAEGRFLQA